MANLVEFILKIKDLGSGTVAKFASNTESSFNKLERGVSRIGGDMNRLKMSIGDIDKRLNDLRKTREISIDSRQVRRINNEMSELERRKARLEGGGSAGMFAGMRGLAAGAMMMAGVAGIGGIADAGMQREATNMRFEVLAGKQQGGMLSGNLNQFAQKTIYGNEVFSAAQTMMGFGIEAKNIMPNIKMLGDIAMGNKERFGSLALAFSQTKAAGRLMGQEVLQMVNAGFNPLQEISKMTGKSMVNLKKDMEDGKVSFAQVAAAFQHATEKGGLYHQMTEKIGTTGFGKFQALKGSIEALAASTGMFLLPAMSLLIGGVQYLVDNTELIFGMAAAWAAYSSAVWFASLATKGLTVWQLLSNNLAKLNPWGAAIAGIILLGTLIVHLWNKFSGFREVVYGLGAAFKQVFTNVVGLIKAVFAPVLEIFEAIQSGNWKKAGMAMIKLNPISTLMRTTDYIANGGLTAGVKNSYKTGSLAGAAAFAKFKTGKSASDVSGAAATDGSGVPASLTDTNNGITGGGVKNLYINVHKFFDDLNIHAASAQQGMTDAEQQVKEMFLRIVNSANQAVS